MGLILNFSIRELLNPHGSPRYKGKRTTCREYLAFAASFYQSCFCGKPFQLDHAVGGRSRNARASDFLVFPNCAEHHIGRGSIESYEREHGIDIVKMFIEPCLRAYANHLNITGVFDKMQDLEMALTKKYRKAA